MKKMTTLAALFATAALVAPMASTAAGHAAAAAYIEVQLVADDHAAATCRLNVAPVPVAGAFRYADERIARLARPVKSIAAEAEADVVRLFAIALLAAIDGEQPEHYALIRDCVEIVELRCGAEVGAFDVGRVRPRPRDRIGGVPRRCRERGRFKILPIPDRRPRSIRAQTENPLVPEWIAKKGAAIAAAARLAKLSPPNAVPRNVEA